LTLENEKFIEVFFILEFMMALVPSNVLQNGFIFPERLWLWSLHKLTIFQYAEKFLEFLSKMINILNIFTNDGEEYTFLTICK
jgi:hypothetical protein